MVWARGRVAEHRGGGGHRGAGILGSGAALPDGPGVGAEGAAAEKAEGKPGAEPLQRKRREGCTCASRGGGGWTGFWRSSSLAESARAPPTEAVGWARSAVWGLREPTSQGARGPGSAGN